MRYPQLKEPLMFSRLLIVVLFILISTTTAAAREDTEFLGQFQIYANGTLPFSKDGELSLYLHGALLYPIDAEGPFMFGYTGLDWTSGNHNLKILTGSYFDAGGSSLIASIWYSHANVLGSGIGFFAEFDLYPPLLGHMDTLMYSYVSAGMPIGNTGGIGVSAKLFASFEDIFEFAVGPTVTTGPLTWWLAYDARPDLPGPALFLRISIVVQGQVTKDPTQL